MRRIVIAALVAALALPLVAAPAQATVYQDGTAIWVRPQGKKLIAYFAMAERFVEPGAGGVITLAGVAKGECRVVRTKHFEIVTCTVFGRLHEIPFEDFVVDPLLGSASMTVTVRGTTHSVSWTANDLAPSSAGGVEAGPWGIGAGAGMQRYTDAEGTVFGKTMGSDDDYDIAVLTQSAGVGVGLPFLRNGRATIRFTRPIKG